MNKLLLAATAAVFALAGSNASFAADKKTLAFVVNGASDFWKAAEAGVKKAQGELPNYNLVFKYPEQASAAIQIRLMDDLVAAGAAGIMVSSADPKTSSDSLNRIGKQVALFTTDSDAPDTSRVAYIGSSNTDAGKQAGQLLLKALPNSNWPACLPASVLLEPIEATRLYRVRRCRSLAGQPVCPPPPPPPPPPPSPNSP